MRLTHAKLTYGETLNVFYIFVQQESYAQLDNV